MRDSRPRMCVTRPKFPQVRRFMLVRQKSHWRGTINTTGRCGRLDGVQGSSFRGDCAHPMLDTVSQRSFSANLLETLALPLVCGRKKRRESSRSSVATGGGVDFRHINNGRLNAPSPTLLFDESTTSYDSAILFRHRGIKSVKIS